MLLRAWVECDAHSEVVVPGSILEAVLYIKIRGARIYRWGIQ